MLALRRPAAFVSAISLATLFAACGGSSVQFVDPDASIDSGLFSDTGGGDTCTLTCGGRCVDSMNDPDNCGACGNRCGTGLACYGGLCGTCPAKTVICSGSCKDISTDTANCGRCGNDCGPLSTCTSGVCGCTKGVLCGGRCIDLSADVDNCGSCGNRCRGATPACVSGICSCPSTSKLCGGSCVDTTTDPQNCGTCGNRCGIGEFCSGSACQCAPGTAKCGTSTVCTSTRNDPANCGACGKACTPGQGCVYDAATGTSSCIGVTGGTCGGGLAACPAGAGFACSDLQRDNLHCGRCDRRCAVDELCVRGNCDPFDATACKTCPCPSCGGGSRCCNNPVPGGNVICLPDSPACP